jgi:NHLM bacteriocin system ABC transporter ATP-binding protein
LLDADVGPRLLVAGSAAVFAVDRETGERIHLFSIEPGEPVLPIACTPNAPWNLTAISLEPCLLESAEDEPEWKSIFALENWLAKMGEAASHFHPAQDVQPITSGAVNLTTGQRIGIEEGMLFVRLDAGDGLLAGGRVPAGCLLALVPGLWIEAAGEARWTAMDSTPEDTLSATVAALAATLDRVTPLLMAALCEFRLRRDQEDQRRFAVRREIDDQMVARAAGILAGRPNERALRSAAGLANPLFAAIRAVTDLLGIPLRAAPPTHRATDPVREIAEEAGCRTRTVLLSGGWWRAENGPLLAFRADGGPVALLPDRIGLFGVPRYRMFDPASGSVQRVDAKAAARLHSYARMIYRPLPDDTSTRNLLRYLLAPRRRELRTIVAAAAAASLLAFAVPQGVALLIGFAIPDANTNLIWQIAAGMFAAAFGSALFLLAQAIATLRAQTAGVQVLQTGVWDYLLKLGPRFFRGFSAGELRARADAVTRIHQLLTADALRSLLAGVAAVPSLALVFWYSPRLALVATAGGIAVLANAAMASRKLYRVQMQWQEMEEALAGVVLQSIQAVSKLRVAGAGNRAFVHWAEQYSRKQEVAQQMRTLRDRSRLVNLTIPAVATTLAFYSLLASPIPLGSFLAAMAALATFLTAITTASDTYANLVVAANLWQRMRTILAAEPEVHAGRTNPGKLRGRIAIENATFRYRQDGPLVLDTVSIRANPGECIALTGPSGSGKSTLINLLLRFESPHSGAVYFDGRDLCSLDITAVRRQIGVVTQDGRVLSGSILENICGGSGQDIDAAWEAARAAGLAEDIEQMPMGMHTRVSDGGGNLSGGQRQRLLIARALVGKPSILIFDEATSALDNRTQATVTESLRRLKATRILVAHRLSTLRNADRIYVIDKGRIVQEGPYYQLVKESGLFARLANRQQL